MPARIAPHPSWTAWRAPPTLNARRPPTHTLNVTHTLERSASPTRCLGSGSGCVCTLKPGQVTEAKAQGINSRALAVINPGNPTGGVLSLQDMQGVVKFCERENLVLCADEVSD